MKRWYPGCGGRRVVPVDGCGCGIVRIQGAQGPQGPPGPQGTAGPRGPAGPSGAAGSVGATGAPGMTGSTGATGPAGVNGTELAAGRLTRTSVTPVLLDAGTRAVAIDWPVSTFDIGLDFDLSDPAAPSMIGGTAVYTVVVNVAVGVGSSFAGEQVNLDLYANGVFIARDIEYTPTNVPSIILFKVFALFPETSPTLTLQVQLTYPFGGNFFSALVYPADSSLSVEKATLA